MPSAKVPKTQSVKKETTSSAAPVATSVATAPVASTPVVTAPVVTPTSAPVVDVVAVPTTTQKSKPKQKKTQESVVVPAVVAPAVVPVAVAPVAVAPAVVAPAEKAPKVQKPKVVRAKKEKEPIQVALPSSEQAASSSEQAAPSSSEQVAQENEQEAGVLVDADLRGGQRPKKRYFACDYENEQFGRVWGVKPKQAANKGFTSILKHMNKSGINYTDGEEINFAIAETTRGSKQGEYLYLGKRVLLEIPIQVTKKIKDKVTKEVIATKQVPYKYKNIVHKVPKVGRVNA